MGQSIESLRPEYRAYMYRQLASAALQRANETKDNQLRVDHYNMAAEWHALAMQAEGTVHRPMRSLCLGVPMASVDEGEVLQELGAELPPSF